jgi:ankyrin repeat protein
MGPIAQAMDINGRKSLYLAATGGYESLLKLLLDEGGGINRKDSNGDVALSLVATRGHNAVVNLLLQNGANLGSCRNIPGKVYGRPRLLMRG